MKHILSTNCDYKKNVVLPEEFKGYKITKHKYDNCAIYKKGLFDYLVLRIKDPIIKGALENPEGVVLGGMDGTYCHLLGTAKRILNSYKRGGF
jgi:hypothetical protein